MDAMADTTAQKIQLPELNYEPWLAIAGGSKARHLDPYIVWTLRTRFRQFIAGTKEDELRAPYVIDFIAELERPFDEIKKTEAWHDIAKLAIVPPIYHQPIPGSGSRQARHITIRLPMQIDRLPEVAAKILQLIALEGVLRLQIGFPRPALAGDSVLPAGKPARRHYRKATNSSQPVSPQVVLGVLEDGCPFGHSSLLAGPLSTRVAALWDQSVRWQLTGREPDCLGYGVHLSTTDLDALLARHADGDAVDEESLYRDPDSLQARLVDEGSHASAVITLMAGDGSRLPSQPPVTTASGDAASSAPVVAVQFPIEQIDVAGARWLVVRALDGLRYLCQSASELAPKGAKPPPLAINLSYGSVVGAHDGTALMETAMDELVESYGELAMVLAAGNAYGAKRDPNGGLERLPSGNHAVGLLDGAGSHATFRLYVPPDKPIETYLELWFEDRRGETVNDEQFLDSNDVQIEVQPPVGEPLRALQFPSIAFDAKTSEDTTAGLLCFRRVAQSRLRSMALLVVAATQVSTSRVEAASGLWTVTVTNRSSRNLRVQGWVERDIVPRTSRSTQAARLLDAPDADPHWAILTNTNTFNNIGTGRHVFRVGALMDPGEANDLRPSPYSSGSRPGQPGPELSSIADETVSSPGIRVSGNTSACVLRMNGTSVAAPQATRWLANQLVQRSLSEIRRELGMPKEGSDERTARRGKRVP